MTKTPKTTGSSSQSAPRTRVHGRPCCLFVGDQISLRRAALRVPISAPLTSCEIFDLSDLLMTRQHPDIVLSFAITPLFDCLDLAQLLCLHGFRQRQRIVRLDLPNPDIVIREVRLTCPDLDFGVLDPAELGPN